MTAAAVFEHKAANVDIGSPVQNGITHSSAAALSTLAVNYPGGNVLLGIEAVNKESVAGINGVNASQVADYNVRSFMIC